MVDVRSKNLYELLGNDPELDSDKEPEPPTSAIEKPAPRRGKRDAPKEISGAPPSGSRGGGRNRGGRLNANEEAFRDRNAGSYQNRNRPVNEHKEDYRRGTRARDDRGGRARSDRHPNRSGHTDTEKQVEQGWGSKRGEAEWYDEKVGEDIAKKDENEAAQATAGEEVIGGEEQQPAEKTKSYAEYLAEQAAARREDLGVKAARAPNEGVKDSKWENAKAYKRDEVDEAYIPGQTEKTKREKQRKEKNYLEVDMRFVEPPRSRGGGRGGRGRGRGDYGRGGNRNAPVAVTVDDENFPSLGSK
ncbi:hypothetical protein VTN49DRAFT_2205 [Thermomyces lanuginosus]|uniref:uncharacterized protein n=1 Tax=Thermomyces lanuginosus TaxID=5541 RepID=UPI0037434E06